MAAMRRQDAGIRPSVLVLVGTALLVAACGTAAGPTPSASPSARPTASPTAASPTPSAPPIATASPEVEPTAAPTIGPRADSTALFPWLPPIDTTVPATLPLDSFVTAAADVVPISGAPGGPPYRFDTGDPDPATHPLMGIGRGGLLVVLHGPVVVDAVEWYLVTPAHLAIDIPTGWAPLVDPKGTRYLAEASGPCPASPMTAEQLGAIALTDGFPACYGRSEVTIEGELSCSAEPDPWMIGASWLAGGVCRLDAPPSVYGLPADLAPGRYVVTGRFDDPEAAACRSADGDDGEVARLMAVLACRRGLVATSATPVGH